MSLAKYFDVSKVTVTKMIDELLSEEEKRRYISVKNKGLKIVYVYDDRVKEIVNERLSERKERFLASLDGRC
jgi:exonuclease III